MRQHLTTILFSLSLLVGEIHTFWEGKTVVIQNWILNVYRPMAVQWNVKFVCMQATALLIAIGFYYYRSNRLNRTAVVSLVMYQIVDTLLYFYNYKLNGYGWIYIGVVAFGIIYYNWQFKRK